MQLPVERAAVFLADRLSRSWAARVWAYPTGVAARSASPN